MSDYNRKKDVFSLNFRLANQTCAEKTQLRPDCTIVDERRETLEGFTKQKWIVTEKNIPDLPFMYNLSSNHMVVTKFCPSIIAKNIQESLRKLSITVLFDNNKVN